MADLEKCGGGGGGVCCCVLTKRVRSAHQPAEGRSFEGFRGCRLENVVKVTLKFMHIKRDFSRFFLFIIAFILLIH